MPQRLLLLLAPDIQEEVLHLPATESGRDAVTLREMRAMREVAEWAEQRKRWRGAVLIKAGRRIRWIGFHHSVPGNITGAALLRPEDG